MKNRNLSLHIWRAIKAQAETVAHSLSFDGSTCLGDADVAPVNEIELKRLRILIRQLEEESPE